MSEPRYMSLASLAETLDVGPSTIKAWVAKGGFPQPKMVGPSKRLRWDWDEVRAHIEYNRPKPKEGGTITNATKQARAERKLRGSYQSIFG